MACIRKRRDRWVIDFYDTQGKRRWKTLPEGTTKAKAKESMREVEDQLLRGIYLPDKKIPIFKKVAKNWLKYKKQNIRATTWAMYEMLLRLHLSEFNDLKINRITVVKVENYIAKKQTEKMKLSTLRRILTTFNQVMKYAVRHRYIDYNPVRDAERPRDQGEVEKPKIRVLNPSEINAFLEVEDDQKYGTLFMLAVMSGARQGELFGLKWTDVDWINSQIHVQRTYNHRKWYKPKSKTSDRKIDLGPEMMAKLRKWKLACPKNDLDLIFPSDTCRPMDQSYMLRNYFFPWLKKAKIERIRFHDLRHTYASLLIKQGENIKYIQSQLGHSSPMVTLNTYTHLFESVNQEAACRLENTVFEKNGSKTVAKPEGT
jgi:integrase